MTIGDHFIGKHHDVDPFFHQVAVMRQLIQERKHPLELLRELIANAAAREVGARTIRIMYYTVPEYGPVFEVRDDGLGMNFTNDVRIPGRLDRFLGLGFSAIAGMSADEFAWKGLGSKLAYQSRRIEIETCMENQAWRVVVNEPWETIMRGQKPRPQVSEMQRWADPPTGTIIKVYGHPPHKRDEQSFEFDYIYNYLTHRTFVGYTRERENPPRICLTVQARTEEVPFGFPELRNLPGPAPEGTVVLNPPIVRQRTLPGKNDSIQIVLKSMFRNS